MGECDPPAPVSWPRPSPPRGHQENAPQGGGRGSTKREAVPHASLVISLATAAAKLLVGGFFFSILGGGFLLVSAWRVRCSWETICFLPPEGPGTWPGVYGLLRPPGSPAQEHAKSDPAHA